MKNISMLYVSRVDVSEGIDANKSKQFKRVIFVAFGSF